MNDGINEKPVRTGRGPERGRAAGNARYRKDIHVEMRGGPVVGPLIGCPLMLLMMVFVISLTLVAAIVSALGGRRLAEFLMRRVKNLKDSPRAYRVPHPNDPDVIDVEGEVIDQPHADE